MKSDPPRADMSRKRCDGCKYDLAEEWELHDESNIEAANMYGEVLAANAAKRAEESAQENDQVPSREQATTNAPTDDVPMHDVADQVAESAALADDAETRPADNSVAARLRRLTTGVDIDADQERARAKRTGLTHLASGKTTIDLAQSDEVVDEDAMRASATEQASSRMSAAVKKSQPSKSQNHTKKVRPTKPLGSQNPTVPLGATTKRTSSGNKTGAGLSHAGDSTSKRPLPATNASDSASEPRKKKPKTAAETDDIADSVASSQVLRVANRSKTQRNNGQSSNSMRRAAVLGLYEKTTLEDMTADQPSSSARSTKLVPLKCSSASQNDPEVTQKPPKEKLKPTVDVENADDAIITSPDTSSRRIKRISDYLGEIQIPKLDFQFLLPRFMNEGEYLKRLGDMAGDARSLPRPAFEGWANRLLEEEENAPQPSDAQASNSSSDEATIASPATSSGRIKRMSDFLIEDDIPHLDFKRWVLRFMGSDEYFRRLGDLENDAGSLPDLDFEAWKSRCLDEEESALSSSDEEENGSLPSDAEAPDSSSVSSKKPSPEAAQPVDVPEADNSSDLSDESSNSSGPPSNPATVPPT